MEKNEGERFCLTEACKPMPPVAMAIVRIGNLLERLITMVGGIAIVMFVTAVFLDVGARVVGKPISWCQEIALFSYVWAIFMGTAIGIRYGTHFTIDLITGSMKGIIRQLVDLFDHTVIMIFSWILCWYGWKYAMNTVSRLSQPSGIPLVYGTICMFVGAVCMFYFCGEYYILFFLGTDIKRCKQEMKEGIK